MSADRGESRRRDQLADEIFLRAGPVQAFGVVGGGRLSRRPAWRPPRRVGAASRRPPTRTPPWRNRPSASLQTGRPPAGHLRDPARPAPGSTGQSRRGRDPPARPTPGPTPPAAGSPARSRSGTPGSGPGPTAHRRRARHPPVRSTPPRSRPRIRQHACSPAPCPETPGPTAPSRGRRWERRSAAASARSSQAEPSTTTAAPEPEPPERAGEPHHRLGVAGLLQPAQRATQIGKLGLEPVEPARLLRSSRCGEFGFLRQLQAPGRVPAADGIHLPAGRQLLEGELADRLQHRDARRSVQIVLHAQQTLIGQGGDELQESSPASCPTASAASRVHPPTNTANRRKRIRSAGASRS